MKRYCLSPHAHCCATDEGIVILDLRANRYVGLSASEAQGIAEVVDRWPQIQCEGASCEGASRSVPTTDGSAVSDDIIRQLESEDLIRATRTGVLPEVPESLPPVATLIEGYDLDGVPPRPTTLHVSNFLIACFRASFSIRAKQLEHIVSHVRKRKARVAPTKLYGVDNDSKVRVLGHIFYHLRPYLFTGTDHCLFDSLAMLEFLARYQVYPAWVFGVRARPFAAHCWVQNRGLVLNSPVEVAKRFTPILIV